MTCERCSEVTEGRANFCSGCGYRLRDLRTIRFGRVLHSDAVERFFETGDPTGL